MSIPPWATEIAPLSLRDDDDDRVRYLAHADPGAVPEHQIAAQVRVLRQGQHAAGGGDAVAWMTIAPSCSDALGKKILRISSGGSWALRIVPVLKNSLKEVSRLKTISAPTFCRLIVSQAMTTWAMTPSYWLTWGLPCQMERRLLPPKALQRPAQLRLENDNEGDDAQIREFYRELYVQRPHF